MAFSRNPQRPSRASPHQPIKRQPRQPSYTSQGCPTPIISTVRQPPDCQKDWSQSMRYLLCQLLQEENKSMEAMLNSSINHFTQYITQHDDMETQNHQLIRQNQRLSAAIEELRTILKQKLETALKKQREDLNVMMQDYIQLIQKLLRDKESIAVRLQEEGKRADVAEEVVNAMAEEQLKSQATLQSKDKVIANLQKKVQEQDNIIQEHRLKIQELDRQNEKLKDKIIHMQSKEQTPTANILFDQRQQCRDEAVIFKSKFLLDLLEQSQAEVRRLRERLRHEGQHSMKDNLITQLQQRIAEMEEEHEEQFKEYDQSMKEVMERKDQQIQKLTKNLQTALQQQRNLSS